jgi:hypothetical protein
MSAGFADPRTRSKWWLTYAIDERDRRASILKGIDKRIRSVV